MEYLIKLNNVATYKQQLQKKKLKIIESIANKSYKCRVTAFKDLNIIDSKITEYNTKINQS